MVGEMVEMLIPPGNKTYRGGKLPEEHRDFFKKKAEIACDSSSAFNKIPLEKKYRAPMFLATSESESTAQGFKSTHGMSGDKNEGVIWNFDFPKGQWDPEKNAYVGCCLHVNKVRAG